MPLQQRIAQLVAQGYTQIDATSLAAFAEAPGDAVLLLTAEPRAVPEAWDALVILPEVLKSFSGRLRGGVAEPQTSRQIAARYGVQRYPALVLLRGGGRDTYVDAIEGLQDWSVYLQRIGEALEKPVGRAPAIGIPVVAAGSTSCH
jgi:hydrogenase-1 operon protein HyaE